MFTATIEPTQKQRTLPWRATARVSDPTPDFTSQSLRILQDRDVEENGPATVFHG
jgi:hypothetical protein